MRAEQGERLRGDEVNTLRAALAAMAAHTVNLALAAVLVVTLLGLGAFMDRPSQGPEEVVALDLDDAIVTARQAAKAAKRDHHHATKEAP